MSMAASPAERRPFGGEILCHPSAPGPASHDGQGRRFLFRAPPGGDPADRYALDVECRGLPPPAALAAALGPRAMALWGELEVVAKLSGQPVHLVLRAHLAGQDPRAAPGLEIRRADTAGHWIVLGRCRGAGPQAACLDVKKSLTSRR